MASLAPAESKPLIVLLEDEIELARLITIHLHKAGMQTQIYNRAEQAGRFLKGNFANLLLLDIDLPDQTGFSLLESLRKEGIAVPVIFLTGNAQETSKIRGLELGGDDYVTKPFSFPELVARIKAVLRRAEVNGDLRVAQNARVSDKAFEFCDARINPHRLEISFPNGQTEAIGRKELGILTFLYQDPGRIITRKALIHAVWGMHTDIRSRSLDQYVTKIRELFKKHEAGFDAFRTVHGIGYLYDPYDTTPRTY